MIRIFFYATRNDILKVTDAVEAKIPLTYYLESHEFSWKHKEPQIYSSAREIPPVDEVRGVLPGDNRNYLAIDRNIGGKITNSRIGGRVYPEYSYAWNERGVQFTPAGMVGESKFSYGLIQTIMPDYKDAQRLMRAFQSAFKKHFPLKLGGFWFGQEILEIFTTKPIEWPQLEEETLRAIRECLAQEK